MDERNKKRCKCNKEILEYLDALLMALVVIALAYTFVLRVVRVDGRSMEKTLLNGERVLTTKLLYTPDYEDIVVIDAYIPHGLPLIKRVIGLEGDVIDIDFDAGIVYRNGEALDEPYAAEPTYTYEGTDFPLTVPEGTVFVMGDNRNNSKDSRLPDIGCIDVRDIMGRAFWRVTPVSRMGALE